MKKNNLIEYEKFLFSKGIENIAGVDEVGRGPLAGPLVVSAVILKPERIRLLLDIVNRNNDIFTEIEEIYTQINDSKKVTAKRRRLIRDFLINDLYDYSIVEIPHNILDKEGVGNSTQSAFYQSIIKLKHKPTHILTDNFEIIKITKDHQTNIKRGDSLSVSIAAASIIAKIHRDNIMDEMHEKYPEYGFVRNKGYGTKEHMEALKKHGPCEIHRKSFKPITYYI